MKKPMTPKVGDWVKYKRDKSERIGEVSRSWPFTKLVFDVDGYPVHNDDILEIRPPQPRSQG